MAYGLRQWDANGNLILDISDRITRYVGQFNTGTSNGSFNTGLTEGSIWFSKIFFTDAGRLGASADVFVSGNTITWNFDAVLNGYQQNCLILYGVY